MDDNRLRYDKEIKESKKRNKQEEKQKEKDPELDVEQKRKNMFKAENRSSDDVTIELVQKFVQFSSAADNFESVYLSFITVFENYLGLENISVYESKSAQETKKTLVYFLDETNNCDIT